MEMQHDNPCGYILTDLLYIKTNLNEKLYPNTISIYELLIDMLRKSQKFILTDVEYATSDEDPSYDCNLSLYDSIAVDFEFGTAEGNLRMIALAFDAKHGHSIGLSISNDSEPAEGVIIWTFTYNQEHDSWFPSLQGNFVPLPAQIIDDCISSYFIPLGESYELALDNGYIEDELDDHIYRNAILVTFAMHSILDNPIEYVICNLKPLNTETSKIPDATFQYKCVSPDYKKDGRLMLH